MCYRIVSILFPSACPLRRPCGVHAARREPGEGRGRPLRVQLQGPHHGIDQRVRTQSCCFNRKGGVQRANQGLPCRPRSSGLLITLLHSNKQTLSRCAQTHLGCGSAGVRTLTPEARSRYIAPAVPASLLNLFPFRASAMQINSAVIFLK